MGQICKWCRGDAEELFYLGVPLCNNCQAKLAAMPDVFDRLAKIGELKQDDAGETPS